MAEDAKQEIIGETEVVVGRSTEIVVSNPEEYALASEILANVAALKKRIVAYWEKAKAEAFASRAAEVSIPASTVESTVPSTVRLTSGGAVTAKKDIEVTVVDKAALLTAYIGTIVLLLVTIVLITRERDRLADELLARPTMDRIVIWKDFTVDGEPLVCFEAVKTYRDIDTAFHGLCDDLTCDFPDTVSTISITSAVLPEARRTRRE